MKDNFPIGCKGQGISQTKVAASLSFFKCGIILHEPGGSGTLRLCLPGYKRFDNSGNHLSSNLSHAWCGTNRTPVPAQTGFRPSPAEHGGWGVIVAMGAVILPDGDQKAGLHAGMVQLFQHLFHFLPVYWGGVPRSPSVSPWHHRAKQCRRGQTVLLHIALRPLQPGKRIRQVIVLSLPDRDRRAALAGRYADNGGVRLSIVGVDKGSYQRAGLHPGSKMPLGSFSAAPNGSWMGEKLFGCGNRPVFKASAGVSSGAPSGQRGELTPRPAMLDCPIKGIDQYACCTKASYNIVVCASLILSGILPGLQEGRAGFVCCFGRIKEKGPSVPHLGVRKVPLSGKSLTRRKRNPWGSCSAHGSARPPDPGGIPRFLSLDMASMVMLSIRARRGSSSIRPKYLDRTA